MSVSNVYKKQPQASHWHRVSAQSMVAAIVNIVVVLRFLSAQRIEEEGWHRRNREVAPEGKNSTEESVTLVLTTATP